jgi:hypothetical protein
MSLTQEQKELIAPFAQRLLQLRQQSQQVAAAQQVATQDLQRVLALVGHQLDENGEIAKVPKRGKSVVGEGSGE